MTTCPEQFQIEALVHDMETALTRLTNLMVAGVVEPGWVWKDGRAAYLTDGETCRMALLREIVLLSGDEEQSASYRAVQEAHQRSLDEQKALGRPSMTSRPCQEPENPQPREAVVPPPVRLKCRACGSNAVHSNEHVSATAYVVHWTLTDDDQLVPEYAGYSEIAWDGQRVREATPFICTACGAETDRAGVEVVPAETEVAS